MKTKLRQFFSDRRGQALLAHALLLSAISMMLVPALHGVATRLADVFKRLAEALR
ncbi:MAG TPA: hypothetical protein VFA53_05995 [Xanthobacteraceae bacterium]|nr:hypothetical protein [Xanthobacteraceae bacterium]